MSDKVNPFAEAKTAHELLGLLGGATSVCWERIGNAGVFQSEVASSLVDDAFRRLIEMMEENNMSQHMNPIPVEKVSSMKGITITERNRPMLAERWIIPEFDWPEVLPLGYILVVDFGNEGEIPFETVTPDLFAEKFNRLYDIENEFFSIERKEIVLPPPTTH